MPYNVCHTQSALWVNVKHACQQLLEIFWEALVHVLFVQLPELIGSPLYNMPIVWITFNSCGEWSLIGHQIEQNDPCSEEIYHG